jgi:hypothetical protein
MNKKQLNAVDQLLIKSLALEKKLKSRTGREEESGRSELGADLTNLD